MDLNFLKHGDCKTVLLQMGESDLRCDDVSMKTLTANTTDGATEKHVPALEYKGGELHVQIGSVEHPMLPEHHIEWILVQTKDGLMAKNLKPGEAPRAVFPVQEADVVAVYEYCNLHGLWKA